jgi:hypothetical protein
MMACTQVTISQQGGIDKYYDCVDGKCIEKSGGQYKNDALCAGKCAAPPQDNTMTYILLAAGILGAALLFGGKK